MLRQVFPSRAIALLLAIGVLDLIVTTWLHATGTIVEMNPIMRTFIDRSEFLFVVVKGMTLLVGYLMLVRFARTNIDFVRKACLAGSVVYVLVWLAWFIHGPGA